MGRDAVGLQGLKGLWISLKTFDFQRLSRQCSHEFYEIGSVSMIKMNGALAAILLMTACSGNPWFTGDGSSATDLPGTTAPSASKSITRYEPTSGGETGDGYAKDFTRNIDGSYTVDNLPFDADNTYTASATQPAGGTFPYTVYEAAGTVLDPQTGVPISQLQHRLLAGVSTSGRTEFAIVRTGSYANYGFGGFVMKRAGGVKLPNDAQATYTGNYAGLRDFNGFSGLEFTKGVMTVDIDLRDFNVGSAVKGTLTDRHIYDINGNEITAAEIAALNAKYNPDGRDPSPMTVLPDVQFYIGPGTIDGNGEMQGNLGSNINDYRGPGPGYSQLAFETGKYYALVSGDAADEIVGIIVIKSESARVDGATVRETGGFLLYRP